MESNVPTFRDPSGILLVLGDRIIRILNRSGFQSLNSFLSTSAARAFIQSGRLVDTRVLGASEVQALSADERFAQSFSDDAEVVEHEMVPFQSFPYEWPPEMLHEAARLTIELAQELLDSDFGLKDATPYNVLFRGPKPVFIDLLSFENRLPGDSVWLPYAQFIRTFLLPLLANMYFSLPLDQVFLARRDGLEPEDLYRLCGPLRRLLPPFLNLVSIPVWLSGRASKDSDTVYQRKLLPDPERARFILGMLLRSAQRSLRRLEPKPRKASVWSDYMTTNQSYTRENFEAKQAFVQDIADEYRPRTVLDVGCNTGHFSAIAARSGARVMAIDYDPVVVGKTWRRAHSEGLDILPLVVNLSRPSPATGWRNGEQPSFLSRARGGFDAVFMLAVVHHMLVSERIPLPEIIGLAGELTTDMLVIEFVAPDDPMFRRLTRGRDELFEYLTKDLFEEECRRHFDIVKSLSLGNDTRHIYLLRKRQTGRRP